MSSLIHVPEVLKRRRGGAGAFGAGKYSLWICGRCASRTGQLAVDNAFALPTAPAFAHKLHRLPPPSERKPEPQKLRPYRGDMYCDAGGLTAGAYGDKHGAGAARWIEVEGYAIA